MVERTAQLEAVVQRCVYASDYAAAERAEKQLQQLKAAHDHHTLEVLAEQHAQQCAAQDARFNAAGQELAAAWERSHAELHLRLQAAHRRMLGRQKRDTEALLAAQASALVRPKHTALPLNLCHSEHQLAAQKEFAKACKVQQQAATQEAFELHNMVSNRLARWEAESAALAALHAKEQCAFDKRAESALLAARMTEQQELKRHCRRHRAARLSLTRVHAVQQLRSVRGSLGLARPSALPNLSSCGTSLAGTSRELRVPPKAAAAVPRPGTSAAVCAGSLMRSPRQLAPLRAARPATALAATPLDCLKACLHAACWLTATGSSSSSIGFIRAARPTTTAQGVALGVLDSSRVLLPCPVQLQPDKAQDSLAAAAGGKLSHRGSSSSGLSRSQPAWRPKPGSRQPRATAKAPHGRCQQPQKQHQWSKQRDWQVRVPALEVVRRVASPALAAWHGPHWMARQDGLRRPAQC